MPNIVFDNIIFNLQKAGGISGVWKELLQRTMTDSRFNCQFLEYAGAKSNLFRKDLDLSPNEILNVRTIGNKLERYRTPGFKKKYDSFIFHSSYYRICSQKQARNVTTVHDFVYEYFRKGLPKSIHHFQKKMAIQSSDAIICVSENTKKDLLEFFPKIKEDKVFVVHNGVSNTFRPLDERKKPDFLDLDGPYVLYVGIRTDPHKNFQSLVHALEKIPSLNLILIGGGPLQESEMDQFNRSIKGRFRQLNNINNEQLNNLYNSAWALVYPSIYEGFGIPILEAQRAGCPVIATNRSSISEVAGNGALLMSNGAAEEILACLENLQDVHTRKSLILNGTENALKFSWDKMASDTHSIYLSLIP